MQSREYRKAEAELERLRSKYHCAARWEFDTRLGHAIPAGDVVNWRASTNHDIEWDLSIPPRREDREDIRRDAEVEAGSALFLEQVEVCLAEIKPAVMQ
jgi:hypothetical protein